MSIIQLGKHGNGSVFACLTYDLGQSCYSTHGRHSPPPEVALVAKSLSLATFLLPLFESSQYFAGYRQRKTTQEVCEASGECGMLSLVWILFFGFWISFCTVALYAWSYLPVELQRFAR
jgi:hypothetical protein